MTTSRRKVLQTLTGAALVAALPVSAWAHREMTTVTDISWNSRTNLLEIIHSYHMHDAQTALFHFGYIDRPDLTSLKRRAQLALYTEEHFNLTTLNGKALPIEIVGAEMDANGVLVYQQVAIDAAPDGLIIDCSMLREIIPGQINNVDVNLHGEIQSLLFKGDDGPKKVSA